MRQKILIFAASLGLGILIAQPAQAANNIIITSPQAGQAWHVNTAQNIAWVPVQPAAYGNAHTVNINLYSMAGSGTPFFIAQNIPDTGSFSWTVPATLPQSYLGQAVVGISLADGSAQGTSSAFTISSPASASSTAAAGPSITRLAPGSGTVGTQVTITGSGLAATGNIVQFGQGNYIPNINSTDNGTALQFTVPSQTKPCPPWNTGACPFAAAFITPGTYSVSVIASSTTGQNIASSTSNSLPFAVTALDNQSGTSTPGQTPNLSEGSLFLVQGSPTVYLVQNGSYIPFTTAQVFLARGYQWPQVQTVSPQQFNQMNISPAFIKAPDGSIIKGNNDSSLYLVTNNGQKSLVPSQEIFNRLGLSSKILITLNSDELQNYPTAPPQQ